MKIACIANFRIPSNITPVIQTIRLCEGFVKAGHDITLYYPDKEQSAELQGVSIADYYDIDRTFETKAFPYMSIPSDDERGSYKLVSRSTLSRSTFTLPTAVRMRLTDADLYITRGVPMAGFLVGLGLPTTIESYSGTFYERSPDTVVLPIIDRLSAFKNVVVPTEEIAARWREQGISSDKTTVIPTAINLSNYADPKSKSEARRELGLPVDRNLIVYTGKLIPARGSRVLVDACADLSETDVVLVGGSDEERAAMRAYLDEQGIENVHVEGWVKPPRVPTYQWAADVLVSASKPGAFNPMEAVPLKIIEYMAAERPIVASSIPGIMEVLYDEHSALLAEPGNPGALRDAIARVLENPELGTELARTAASKATEYSWERRAQRIVESALDV